jgi:hypothetical protein
MENNFKTSTAFMKISLMLLVCLFYFSGFTQKSDSLLAEANPLRKVSKIDDKVVVINFGNHSMKRQFRSLVVLDGIPISEENVLKLDMQDIDEIQILNQSKLSLSCRQSGTVIIMTSKAARFKKITIKDEDGLPVAGASLSLLANNTVRDTLNFVADADGVVATDKLLNSQSYTLKVSSIGYQSKTENIYFKKTKEENITLKKQYSNCDEVVVMSYGITRKCRLNCCIGATRMESFLKNQNEISKKGSFKIFPNPARRGTEINIQLPNETSGGKIFQLYNLSGQLIFQQQIDTELTIQKIQLPYTTSGTYHLLVLNNQSHKVFADNLVVL